MLSESACMLQRLGVEQCVTVDLACMQTFAEKVAQNTDGDTGPNPSTAFSQSPAGVSGAYHKRGPRP